MSVTKQMDTPFTGEANPQAVKFTLDALRLDSITKKANLKIWGLLTGRIGDATQGVAKVEQTAGLQDVLDEFSAEEKTAAKTFLSAMERVLKDKSDDLKDETYDNTDTF